MRSGRATHVLSVTLEKLFTVSFCALVSLFCAPGHGAKRRKSKSDKG